LNILLFTLHLNVQKNSLDLLSEERERNREREWESRGGRDMYCQ